MKNQEKIKNLYKEKIKKLLKFNKAYFDKDSPIVSDSDFDKLKKELIELAAQNPYLKKIENLDTLIGSKPSSSHIFFQSLKCRTKVNKISLKDRVGAPSSGFVPRPQMQRGQCGGCISTISCNRQGNE